MLQRIDEYFLEKCEKFSHCTQRNIGLNCFSWAKISFIFAYICMLVFFLFSNTIIGTIAAIVLGYIFFIIFKLIDVMSKTNFGKRKNILGSVGCPIRIMLVFVSSSCILIKALATIHVPYINFFNAVEVFFTITFYFVSCTPLPPSESKSRKKIRELLEKIRNEQPLPSPISG